MLSRPSEGIFCMRIALFTAGFLFLTFYLYRCPIQILWVTKVYSLFAIRGHDSTLKPLVSLSVAF